jgi:hypothetical protein
VEYAIFRAFIAFHEQKYIHLRIYICLSFPNSCTFLFWTFIGNHFGRPLKILVSLLQFLINYYCSQHLYHYCHISIHMLFPLTLNTSCYLLFLCCIQIFRLSFFHSSHFKILFPHRGNWNPLFHKDNFENADFSLKGFFYF